MEYPGITICSQGWIQEVVDNAIVKQAEEYIANTHGLDINTIYEILHGENDTLRHLYEEEINNELYPGATASVSSMVTSMTTNNPVSIIIYINVIFEKVIKR